MNEPSFLASAAGTASSKKQPHVAAPPRTRPLECRRKIHPSAGLDERGCILQPTALVEIDGQEEARLIQKHGINAGDEG